MSDALGLLEVARVPGAVDTSTRAFGIAARPCAARCRRTWCRARRRSAAPASRSSPRRSQFDGCAPCPSAASWCGEPLDGVPALGGRRARPLAGQRGEERLREPAVEERVDAVALDLLREALVGVAACRARRRRRRCRATRSPAPAARTSSGRSSASCRHSRPPMRVARRTSPVPRRASPDACAKSRRSRDVGNRSATVASSSVGDRRPRRSASA